jgi:threonine dehydratase
MKQGQADFYLKQDHRANILKARENLRGVLRETPLLYSDYFSSEFDCDVYIKPESLQITGSFKIRGAYNKICALSPDELRRGVVASSAGNHAQGVAFSAQAKNIPATIVMPNVTPFIKISATKAYGADVVIHGDAYDESYGRALALAEERGCTFIHPFDDYDVICGQGTLGLEIMEELKDVDEIIVPVGGGGLLSGVALIVKAQNPRIRVTGVEPTGAMSMKLSLDEKRVSRLAELKTCAEGVAVKRPGDLTFAIAREYADDIVTVTERDIMEAVLITLERHKLIAETAGVIPLAALKKRAKPGKKIVCLLSGGNIDMVTISSIINQGLISRGRIMCFSVELPDRPGQLVKVAGLLADSGANVIELQHNQFKAIDRYSNKVALEVTVETNGQEHISRIIETLEDSSFTVIRIY